MNPLFVYKFYNENKYKKLCHLWSAKKTWKIHKICARFGNFCCRIFTKVIKISLQIALQIYFIFNRISRFTVIMLLLCVNQFLPPKIIIQKIPQWRRTRSWMMDVYKIMLKQVAPNSYCCWLVQQRQQAVRVRLPVVSIELFHLFYIPMAIIERAKLTTTTAAAAKCPCP